MDWETLYCPNRCCRFYGDPLPQSRLVKNGSSHGQPQALCRACGQSVTVRDGTAYWDLNAEPAIFEMAIRALAEGNSRRSTARIGQIDKDTACDWLDRAAQHCRKVLLDRWRDLPVTACQLDELWSFVHTQESHLAMAKRVCETSGDAWIWMAFAPVWRLVLAFVVGKRTQERANLLLHRVAHVTAQRLPLFTSDQLPEYRTPPAARLWTVGATGSQRESRAFPRAATNPAAGFALCTSRQTPPPRTRRGGDYQGHLWQARRHRRPPGGAAHQHNRQHQLCGAREPDVAPAQQATDAQDPWLSQGVDLAGKTTLAVLVVLSSRAAPRELAAAPAGP
jgi:transposase-like protein/IS1 family transposase